MIRKWTSVVFLRLAVLVLCVCAACGSASADDIVTLQPNEQFIDLSVHGATVSGGRRNFALEVPGDSKDKRVILELASKSPGPQFNWTIHTIVNPAVQGRDLVLSIDALRLSESGFLPLEPFGRQALQVVAAGAADRLVPQSSSGVEAYAFHLDSNTSITFAVESPSALRGIRIYDANAFAQRESSVSFLRGATLTLTLVIALFTIGLYGVRNHGAFLVGGIFALSCLQFMALEAGYLDRLAQLLPERPDGLQVIRAISETTLATGFSLAVWGLTAPNRQSPRQGILFIAVLVVFAGLVFLATRDPYRATAFARLLLVIMALSGFIAALRARQNNDGAMEHGMVFWSALVTWIFFATIAALGQSSAPVFHAGILAGLAALVAVMAFALAKLAFAQGYLANPYLSQSSSRSLALAGARHILWDWQPLSNELHLGKELAQLLGYAANRFSGEAAARALAAIVHPADAKAYNQSLDVRKLQAGDYLSSELRLQNAQGGYLWFLLRASTLPGASAFPERVIGTLTDITASKQSAERLLDEATRDSVTGLPSRAIFIDRLEREIAKPIGLPLRVLHIGISRFKVFNDGLGHDLGDQLLMVAGQRIAERLQAEETLTRLNGSMFAVMYVENMARKPVKEFAEELAERLSEPMVMASQEVFLAVSIGVSRLSSDGLSADEMQQQAASALLEAQDQGPHTSLIYEGTMKDERADQLALESDLRRAIDRHEIEVYYQPIIELHNRQIAGFEALVRWNHPERGTLAPADFIGMAEQAGLIGEVGDLVLVEATRQLGIWQRTLSRQRELFVAVNVSADQLADPGFFERVSGLITRDGLRPHSLKIEITESIAMRYPERARQQIAKLRELGVSVACDDFGTGFSNLASLRDLNFDTLKMDRSFIMPEAQQGRGVHILEAVVALAHRLGMNVVAEGIETEEQAVALAHLSCDYGQGYLLGLPMPSRDVPALLAVLPIVASNSLYPALAQTDRSPLPGFAPMAPRAVVEPLEIPQELPSIFAMDGVSKDMRNALTSIKQSRRKIAKKTVAKKLAKKATIKAKPKVKRKIRR